MGIIVVMVIIMIQKVGATLVIVMMIMMQKVKAPAITTVIHIDAGPVFLVKEEIGITVGVTLVIVIMIVI